MITQLVFEHSLRIRLRSDILDEKKDNSKDKKGKKKDGGSTESGGGSSHGPATPSTPGGDRDQAVEGITEAGPDGGHGKEETGHLVGKINNLITGDISTLTRSYDILDFREYGCILFLFWRAA